MTTESSPDQSSGLSSPEAIQDKIPSLSGSFSEQERDSCAVIAVLSKTGRGSHRLVHEALEALQKMEHRAGQIRNEGDGCGIQMDIPKPLWRRWLQKEGLEGDLVEDPRFVAGHLYLRSDHPDNEAGFIKKVFREEGFEVLMVRKGQTLPKRVTPFPDNQPHFWQVALLSPAGSNPLHATFHARTRLERDGILHIASLSPTVVVYKVKGTSYILADYFLDFQDPQCQGTLVLGHSRYSTNTLSVTERVQPFSVLGHNGEINTIDKLRRESAMLGIPPVASGSDSQDLDRTLEGLMVQFGFSLIEAMEILFPPVTHIISALDDERKSMYFLYRRFLGPLAQGPAAIIARYGNEAVFSVDALGLRPLWTFETESTLYFSSERGIIRAHQMVAEPKPFSPGEKMAVLLSPGGVRLLDYPEIQNTLFERFNERIRPAISKTQHETNQGDLSAREFLGIGKEGTTFERPVQTLWNPFGFATEDLDILSGMASIGMDPVGSLGFDGPLAPLNPERQNIPDYFKESVAVVTNPAIDREREMEHFSPRIVLGPRPYFGDSVQVPKGLDISLPILLGGHLSSTLPLPVDRYRALAKKHGTYLLEDLPRYFPRSAIRILDSTMEEGSSLRERLEDLGREAIEAARAGTEILVIDDSAALRPGRIWLEPALTVATVDRALRRASVSPGSPNLRRSLSLIVHSGAFRNLHDLIFYFSMGADAMVPYLMLESVLVPPKGADAFSEEETGARLDRAVLAMQKGIEKIISTMGIHEMRGYGRLMSSIGLSVEVSELFATPNFFTSEKSGLSWSRIEGEARARAPFFQTPKTDKSSKVFHLYPKVWKLALDVANSNEPYAKYQEKLSAIEAENPISIRHLLDLVPHGPALSPDRVDVSVLDQTYPFVISSMSFGSQGEVAYRAYAEAAEQLGILSLNGEGGEIQDMLGKYPKSRGQQIASGRFGVNIRLLNSSNLLEIKIGQGAKPGEGGHLPGRKVSQKIARARRANPGVDLISPSNNHDLYSIEDLAQLVAELKSANPKARVNVKIPVIPGVGTIGIGIAKAGADIITVSGYDGGTGAARIHALKYGGLPVEIGVSEVHRALLSAGLRDQVELWGDGGLKSSVDVVKLMCLGANRAGFGTLPMVAIGCTICRECQTDTCHVGIATQIETEEEAARHGLKRFVPRDYEFAVRQLVHFFRGMGEDFRRILGTLGVDNAQSIVGNTSYLAQMRHFDRLDLTTLLNPLPYGLDVEGVCGIGGVPDVTMTEKITEEVFRELRKHPNSVVLNVASVSSQDRNIGTHLSGTLYRDSPGHPPVDIRLGTGSVAGNGMGSFLKENMTIHVSGGAQDGVGKGAIGGKVVVLKSRNQNGRFVDGSVGKSLGYGAQGGLFLIQGNCDSRACIRLSGADVVIGGRITGRVDDGVGHLGLHANLKGFAFEYMTNGRAVVLGDPGPWICAGMTGGSVYLMPQPEFGFDLAAIRRRIAKGAKVVLSRLLPVDTEAVNRLLGEYENELRHSGQAEEADWVHGISFSDLRERFVRIIPESQQTEQDISTE